MNKKILIVDDDVSVTETLSLLLKRHGYFPVVAFNPEQTLQAIAEQQPALVIQDMNFSRSTAGDEGLKLLQRIRESSPDLPVILITAWASVDLAVAGMKLGAKDFIAKPWGNARLLQAITTAFVLQKENQAVGRSRNQLDAQFDFNAIVGEDPALVRVLDLVGRVSQTDAPVLILGESGTGKELIADAIHNNSQRKQFAHVKVNLGGIPANLFESEMFGHTKGAFTDAKSEREGYFAVAHRGTLFLDEIGELEKSSQVKLLRVLQDQRYRSLGSSRDQQADIRVITATNRDLGKMVMEKAFREDLFYRINLITVHLPPLRERRGDIAKIVSSELEDLKQRYNYQKLSTSDSALQWLHHQTWPGNIRQLRQTIERAVLMSGREKLEAGDFINAERIGDTKENPDALLPVGSMTLEEMEKAMIQKALQQYQHNLTQVASALGLSRQSLYRRLEKYGG